MSLGARRLHSLTTSGRARVGDAKAKRPARFHMLGVLFWRRPTLAQPIVALPSGLQRFTSVFGMGTGGATALLSPDPSPECFSGLGSGAWSEIRYIVTSD